MTDTTTSAARFAADGFLVLHPEQVFTPTELSELERLASAALPAWADGSVNPLENDSHADPRFDYAIDREDGVQLRGVALRQRSLKHSDGELKHLCETMPRAEFLEFFNAQVEKVEDERYLNPSCHKSCYSKARSR